MSAISDWLETNADALAQIGESTGLDRRLVEMTAVFVLAKLDDEQIDAQLFGHGFSINDDRRGHSRLLRALREIRVLAEKNGMPAGS